MCLASYHTLLKLKFWAAPDRQSNDPIHYLAFVAFWNFDVSLHDRYGFYVYLQNKHDVDATTKLCCQLKTYPDLQGPSSCMGKVGETLPRATLLFFFLAVWLLFFKQEIPAKLYSIQPFFSWVFSCQMNIFQMVSQEHRPFSGRNNARLLSMLTYLCMISLHCDHFFCN